MTAASVPVLRPLSLGELLDQTFRLYRQNFLTFLGLIAIGQVPVAILQLLSNLVGTEIRPTEGPESLVSFFPFLSSCLNLIVILATFVLVQSLATAALTRAASDSYLGRPVSLGGSFRQVQRTWSKLLWASFLGGLAVLGLFIWFLVPVIGWFTGLGMIFFFSSLVMRLLAPVVVLEGKVNTAAIRRSWDLARRRFWWLVGFALVLVILGQLLLAGPSALASYLMLWLFNSSLLVRVAGQQELVQTIVGTTVTLLMTILYLPLEITGVTLVYFDLRIRTEGLDLALMTNESLVEAETLPDALMQAPLPENTGVVNLNELLKFAALSILPIIFIVIVYTFIFAVAFFMFRDAVP